MTFAPIRSVVKALSIIEVLTGQNMASGEVTLSEISRQTGIPSTTARNLLRTLESCGYAHKVRHGCYREGRRCYKLFHNEGVLRQLGDAARPILEALVAELGESVLITAIQENRRTELLRIKAPDEKTASPEWHANARPYQA